MPIATTPTRRARLMPAASPPVTHTDNFREVDRKDTNEVKPRGRRGVTDNPDLFWLALDINDETGCWEWSRSLVGDGYGMVRFNGKKVGVHRVAWMLEYGPTFRRTDANRPRRRSTPPTTNLIGFVVRCAIVLHAVTVIVYASRPVDNNHASDRVDQDRSTTGAVS